MFEKYDFYEKILAETQKNILRDSETTFRTLPELLNNFMIKATLPKRLKNNWWTSIWLYDLNWKGSYNLQNSKT